MSNKKPTIIQHLKNSQGVVFVEFALIGTLFIGFLWCTMEVARYLAVRMVLMQAAQEAVIYASKISDGDMPKWTDQATINPNYDSVYLNTVRPKIVARALSIIDSSFIARSTSSSSAQKLKLLTVDGPANGTSSAEIAIIRPGDSFAQSGGESNLINPICSNTVNPTESTFSSLLRSCPYVVEIRATVNPVISNIPIVGATLGLPPISLSVRSVAYREPPPMGNPGSSPPIASPTPLPSNTPTNTRTPTNTNTGPTPTNTNTPTATRTNTPTLTRTQTNTPTITRTPTNTNTGPTPTRTDTAIPTATRTMTPTPTKCMPPGKSSRLEADYYCQYEKLYNCSLCSNCTCDQCNDICNWLPDSCICNSPD